MVVQIISALIITCLVTVIACPFFIKRMKLLQYGQQIRDDGPTSHSHKAGTPTMGGVVFILAATLVSIVMVGFSPLLIAVLLVSLGCGLIGFLDDYLKVARGRSLGLKARSKLAAQAAIAVLFMVVIWQLGLYSSELTMPFIDAQIDMGYLYPLLIFLIILATSNSVNLTDGVDGLAAGTAVIALVVGKIEIALFSAALAGGCLGFLFYNRHPARLFMGDVGSLFLGGAFAAIAVLTKTELLLLIIGGVFVIEALSVIAQVASFKLFGKRILRMSPLHHHFELKGWSEWRVVYCFWGVALFFAVLGVISAGRQLSG